MERRKKNALIRKQEMPICGLRSGKNCTVLAARDVGGGSGHRTKKEKKDLSYFEKFVTEGNEKADDLAEAGPMLDEDFMAEARAKQCSRSEKRCTQPHSMQPACGGTERL